MLRLMPAGCLPRLLERELRGSSAMMFALYSQKLCLMGWFHYNLGLGKIHQSSSQIPYRLFHVPSALNGLSRISCHYLNQENNGYSLFHKENCLRHFQSLPNGLIQL